MHNLTLQTPHPNQYPQQEQEQHQILKPFFTGFLGITTFPPTHPLYFFIDGQLLSRTIALDESAAESVNYRLYFPR